VCKAMTGIEWDIYIISPLSSNHSQGVKQDGGLFNYNLVQTCLSCHTPEAFSTTTLSRHACPAIPQKPFQLRPCPDILVLPHPRSLFNYNLVQTCLSCHTPEAFSSTSCSTTLSTHACPAATHVVHLQLLIPEFCYQTVQRLLPLPLVATALMTAGCQFWPPWLLQAPPPPSAESVLNSPSTARNPQGNSKCTHNPPFMLTRMHSHNSLYHACPTDAATICNHLQLVLRMPAAVPPCMH
jgi:hypothetical protein